MGIEFHSVSFRSVSFSIRNIFSCESVCVCVLLSCCKFYFLLETIEKPIKPTVSFCCGFCFLLGFITDQKEFSKLVMIHKAIDFWLYPLDSIGRLVFFRSYVPIRFFCASPDSFMDQLKRSKKRQSDI